MHDKNPKLERDAIQPGDLLVWSKDRTSVISNFFLKLVRFFTVSDYAHVSVAMRDDGKLAIIEATIPEVRKYTIDDKDEFYHIPMYVEWKDEYKDFLLSKIGMKYSILDAIRAYLGITLERDDRYQCVELANEFYKLAGIDLGDVYTPNGLVYTALDHNDTYIKHIPAL